MSHPTPPDWKKGKVGYDATSRRYRDKDGNIISKRDYRSLISGNTPGEGDYGGYVQGPPIATPMSDAFGRMEGMVGGLEQVVEKVEIGRDGRVVSEANLLNAAEKLQEIIGYARPKTATEAQPIPQPVLSMMRLSDFYTITEGDIWQHIASPIEIAVNELDIQCADEGAKERMETIVRDFDIQNVLAQIWLSTTRYGSAYPLIVFDKKDIAGKLPKDAQLSGIALLPPKNMWVGYHIGNDAPMNLNPFNEQGWSEQAIKDTFMPMTYNSFQNNWNEQSAKGFGVPLNPKYLKPVRTLSLDTDRYPYPDLARAYRQISTRYIFEEVVRATVEGHKSQLWVFKLMRDGDVTPTRAEIQYLNAVVGGQAGKRTGNIVWRGNLVTEQHVPKSLDDMLGNESWQQFTMRIYRQLGGNARLVTGNGFMGDRGDAGIEVDLNIWLKRMDAPRMRGLKWVRHLFNLIAEAEGEAFRKAVDKTTFAYQRSLLDNSELIKKELMPLYQAGLLDNTTALKKAGYAYDQVVENKKKEQKDAELFMPPATYNQTATDSKGNTKSVATSPKGRPSDVLNPKKVLAAVEDEKDRKVLFAEIYAALRFLLESGDVDKFIESMSTHLYLRLGEIAQAGYESAGGVGEVDDKWKTSAANFVGSYLEGLRRDMKKEGADLSKFERRVLMYPEGGSRMAFTHGVQAAMEARGATYWQRLVHAEASESGPCELCLADSTIIHDISEPMLALHPHEQCSFIELHVRFFSGGIPSVEIPIPGHSRDEWDEILKGLGKQGKPVIRRRRTG